MKQNMAITDRTLRAIAAVLIAAFYFGDVISGTLGTILALLAVVFLATGAMGFCPLYVAFKSSTRKVEDAA